MVHSDLDEGSPLQGFAVSGVPIGAQPFPSAIPVDAITKKGDTRRTGEAWNTEEDEGLSSTSPSEITSALSSPSWTQYSNIDRRARDHSRSLSMESSDGYQSTMQSGDPIISFKASSPISFLSTPDTPISFNFSPRYQERHIAHQSSQSSSYFPRMTEMEHSGALRRQDSMMTDATEPYASPSTSYASSSKVPHPFPYQDRIEPVDPADPKGKGKAKAPAESREASPDRHPSAIDVTVPQMDPDVETLAQDSAGDRATIQPGAESLHGGSTLSLRRSSTDSSSGVRSRRSHIGLSFSDQRFTAPSHSAHYRLSLLTFGRRRSQSVHSLRRPLSPVPSIRTRSGPRSGHERSASFSGKRSSFKRFLSLASRTKSFRKRRKAARRARADSASNIGTYVDHQLPEIHPQTSPLVPVSPLTLPSPVTPSQALQSLLIPTPRSATSHAAQSDSPQETEGAASSSSGSTTIKYSSFVAGTSGTQNEADNMEEVTLEEPSGSIIIASGGGPRPPSILVSGREPLPAARPESLEVAGSTPPSSAFTAARPPKLKFVGRSNTSPAPPYAEVSVAVASGSSTSPFLPQQSNLTASVIAAPTYRRAHSNSSVSQPDHSLAFTYIHTLPPLIRPIPQPDGCGQVLDESPSAASPTFSTVSRSRRSTVAGANLFDSILPHEMHVEIFRMLVQLHIREHEELVKSDDWSVGVATGAWVEKKPGRKNRQPSPQWVGFERGVREIVKLGRVSRSWRALSLDGQLWATTSFSKFPQIPISFLLRITESVGPFMKIFDLRGVPGVTGPLIIDLVDNLRGSPDGAAATEDRMETHETERSWHLYDSHGSLHGSLKHLPKVGPPTTRLTSLYLQGCSAITTRSLHTLLSSSPILEILSLKGLTAVTNATCELIGIYCSANLVKLDLSKCPNISANGVEDMIGSVHTVSSFKAFSSGGRPRYPIPARRFPKLKELRMASLKRATGQTMFFIGWGLPELEVLDLGGAKTLSDEDIEVFVRWDERFDDIHVLDAQLPPSRTRRLPSFGRESTVYDQVVLTSREMGLNPMSTDKYPRRLTRLRHLCLTACPLLTDAAPGSLAHSVPQLEIFELGGIGGGLRDTGLIRLFATTPWIRRVDLEDASEITDNVVDALTPPPPPPIMDQMRMDGRGRRAPVVREPNPGELLEEVIFSYADNLGDAALLSLIHACTKLKVMEVDNTRASDQVVKEFVKVCRRRQVIGAEILAVDCRNVTRTVFSEGTGSNGLYLTRNRRGYRAWETKGQDYYDERDKRDPLSGADAITGSATVGDECDERRVVVKTFHSWQAVDNMIVARERRRKVVAAKKAVEGTGEGTQQVGESSRGPRWLNWRNGSRGQPRLDNGDIDGVCVIM